MTLKALADIKAPQLIDFDRESIVDEIIERIKLNKNWDEIYDGELHHNASQFIMHLLAFMAEKNAESFNVKLKEKFFKHAFSEEAIYQNLTDKGINLIQSKNATVKIKGILENKLLLDPLVFDKFFQIPAININSESIIFELIAKNADGSYDYLSNVIVNPDTYALEYFELEAYAGKTQYELYELDETMLENTKIEMNLYNVEEGSVQVYFQDTSGVITKLLITDTFNGITKKTNSVFQNGIPYYQLKYNAGGQPVILFGSSEFGGAFDLQHVGGHILVYARESYGSSGLIVKNGINYTTQIEVVNNESVTITFSNDESSYGGADAEDIYHAKEYGPLRYGRERGIIDKQDAEIKLSTSVIKHKIDTPNFENDIYSLPILHALHKVVPLRTFSTFEFPDIDDNETLETYVTKLINAFTDFCNVIGMHDKVVVDEVVTDEYIYPNSDMNTQIDYILSNKNILSGSLYATAYDRDNKILDYIKWTNNYVTSPISNAAEHDKVTRVRSKTFASINIIDNLVNTSDTTVDNGKNNLLYIEFDDYDYIFKLHLPTGAKNYNDFAKTINRLIIEEIKGAPSRPAPQTTAEKLLDPYWGSPVENMLNLVNHNFVTYEVVSTANGTGRLIFNSTKTGRSSKIVFHDYGIANPNKEKDLYYLLGVASKIYRPGRETGWVFDGDSSYNSTLNQLTLKIYNENIKKQKTFDVDEIKPSQNKFKKTGPIVELVLTGENDIKDNLFLEYDIDVYAKAKYSEIVGTETVIKEKTVGHLTFSDVANITTNEGIIGTDDPTQTDPNRIGVFKSIGNKLDYQNSKLTLQLVDGASAPYYDQGFDIISYIRIVEVDDNNVEITSTTNAKIFAEDTWSQDVSQLLGPEFNVSLSNVLLYSGKNYKFEFVNVNATTFVTKVIDYIILKDVDTTLTNVSASERMATGTVLATPLSDSYVNFVENKFHVKTINGVINMTLNTYTKNWETFDSIEVIYYRKNYDHITVGYTPNIYKPEKEAKLLMDMLKESDGRLVGLENIMKSIKFVPFGVSIALTVKKNYSLNTAVSAVREFLMSEYSYNNSNDDSDIDETPTSTTIKNKISTIFNNYGIVNAIVGTTLDTYVAKHYSESSYFFILDESVLKLISAIEANNSALSGLASTFKINITASFE